MQDTSSNKPESTLPIGKLTHSILEQIELAWPTEQWRKVHVLLAVSGGADSTAMLRAVSELVRRFDGPGELHAAHLNHGLRGAESDADQAWLAALCAELGISLWTERIEIAKSEAREGWEAAARDARYRFFAETAERIGARFVTTAHTANDQAETVLHRMLRGTGIDGLAGIPFSRPLTPSVMLVRPLLEVTRKDVLEYLCALRQEYRVDASNSNSQYTRNWLRNELLPSIRQRVNPDVDRALLRLSQQAAEFRKSFAENTDRLDTECVKLEKTANSEKIGEVHIAIGPLGGESSLAIRELLKRVWQKSAWPMRDMGFEQWQQLADLVERDRETTVMLPGAVRAERIEGQLILSRS